MHKRKEGYKEDKGHQEQCCNEVYNVRGLHMMLESRNRNDAGIYKIQIIRGQKHDIRNKNRSKFDKRYTVPYLVPSTCHEGITDVNKTHLYCIVCLICI